MEYKKEEIVRSCKLFAELGDASLASLVTSSRFQKFKKGEVVFSADDKADGLRIILDGTARVCLTDPDGRELTLAIMGEGENFGEIALLDGKARSADVVALDNLKCLFLPNEAMKSAMKNDIELMQCLVQSLCSLMRHNMSTISSFAFNGLAFRLAHLIYQLSQKHADVVDGRAAFSRRFSQTDLGSLLGVSREAINKRFKALQYDGLVDLENNVIVVPDLDALKERVLQEEGLIEKIG